jgi:hypothetical protein
MPAVGAVMWAVHAVMRSVSAVMRARSCDAARADGGVSDVERLVGDQTLAAIARS